MTDDPNGLRCPICGVGVVVDLAFAGAADPGDAAKQEPSARQVITYSCGHERLGSRLGTADQEQLEVERRASEDTIDAPPEDGAGEAG